MNTEDLVKAYIAIRTERDRILREYEAADAVLKSDMSQLETAMLSICNDVGADTIKTAQGTIMRRTNERYFCSDWDNFRQFVIDNEAVELLERRVHQGNLRQYMTEHVDDGMPPGLNVTREYGVSVRKPTSK